MNRFVTVHSRNAHKLRIYDPIQWIVQAFAPRRRRLFMRKGCYYEQLKAVNNNTDFQTRSEPASKADRSSMTAVENGKLI